MHAKEPILCHDYCVATPCEMHEFQAFQGQSEQFSTLQVCVEDTIYDYDIALTAVFVQLERQEKRE